MIHRRVLLKGCAAALLSAPYQPVASFSEEPPNLAWIRLRKYAQNRSEMESLATILGRRLEFVDFSSASTKGNLGSKAYLVIPGPGDFSSLISKSGWKSSQGTWQKRVSALTLEDGSYQEVSRLLDAGLFPLSFASFGIICKPAQLDKRKVNIAFDKNWKQRIANLSKLKAQGKPPIALGNNDGMSGLYLFSAISLSVVGLAQHSRIISGDSFFTLNSIVSILKRIQQLQSFFVGKVNTVSQSDALANVIEDKSLLTFDWTNFQEEFELWDSQQLSFLTIDPVLRGKEKSKLCEFAIEFVFAESTNGETEFNELLTSTFSPAQTRLMNNMYTNLLILNERKEQQWPGLANSLSNLAASKVTTTRSLALGLPAELAIGGILPLISDFLEKPTDQNVNRCAESILRLN